jgi:uncharacterized protein
MTERTLTWRGCGEPARFEQSKAELRLGRLHARGTMLFGGSDPYRVDYELDTVEDYITRRLLVRAVGATWSRELRLSRDSEGGWSARRLADPADGLHGLADVDLLDSALDCDLAYCPMTNLMPVLRHRLHRQPGKVDMVMAWVQLPQLVVVRSGQSYEHLTALDGGGARIRFSSGTFAADITVDRAGFVTDYPTIAQRA